MMNFVVFCIFLTAIANNIRMLIDNDGLFVFHQWILAVYLVPVYIYKLNIPSRVNIHL